MLLIGPLPVRDQAALCQKNEQVEGIETCRNRRLPDETMGEVLLSAACFILALEDQNPTTLEHPVRFLQCIPVKTMKALFIREYPESPVDAIARSSGQGFARGRQERRVEHHTVDAGIIDWQTTSIRLRYAFSLWVDIKAQQRRINSRPVVKSPNAVGGITVDLPSRNMELQDISDDFSLVI